MSQLDVRCIAGPTRPLEPILTSMAGKTEGASIGDVAWRIVNMLSLNHLGLVQRAGGESAKSLREMLALFADMSDSATERKIRGIRSVESRADRPAHPSQTTASARRAAPRSPY